MSLFSKLNLKEVARGLYLSATYHFYSQLLARIYESASHFEQEIDITVYCDQVFEATIIELQRNRPGKVNFSAATNRLAEVADSTLNLLTVMTDQPTAGMSTVLLEGKFEEIEREVLISARKGYLDDDYTAWLIITERVRDALSEVREEFHTREFEYQRKQKKQIVGAQEQQDAVSETESVRTTSSDLSGGLLRCVSCGQTLMNIPPDKLIRISCPKCKAKWLHDGRE